jgi:hypothetical protein
VEMISHVHPSTFLATDRLQTCTRVV